MSTSTPLSDRGPLAGRFWLAAGIALALFWLIYVLAVLTPFGQWLENTGLLGAYNYRQVFRAPARAFLRWIDGGTTGLALVVIVAIGLARRLTAATVVAVGVVVVPFGIVEVLKLWVLPRPGLVDDATSDILHNSFPSGHTTIAMGVLFALTIIVPERHRVWVMAFGAVYALGVGANLVGARAHRLSDTLGAGLAVFAVACVGVAWLVRTGRLATAERPGRGQRWVTIPLMAFGAASLVAGVILIWPEVPFPGSDGDFDYDDFVGSILLAATGSIALALSFWHLLQGFEASNDGAGGSEAVIWGLRTVC